MRRWLRMSDAGAGRVQTESSRDPGGLRGMAIVSFGSLALDLSYGVGLP